MDWNKRYSENIGIPEFPFSRTVAQLKYVKDLQSSLKCKGQLVLLDLGCGSGIHYPVAKRYSYRYIGIDLSPIAVALTKKRITSSLDLAREMDLRKLDFPDRYFDVVLERHSIDMLDMNHAHDAVKEVMRVLNDDGFLIGTFAAHIGHRKMINIGSYWRQSQLNDLLKGFQVLQMIEVRETDLLENDLKVIEIAVVARKKKS